MTRQKRSTRAAAAQQAAAIPFRHGSDGPELCLIRRRGSDKWAIPKGFIDPGYSAPEAALIEAFEEAGLEGRVVGGAIGTYVYKKWNARLTVAVYLMEVLATNKHWEEIRLRERRWRSLKDARALLAGHPVRSLWDDIVGRLTG